MASGASVNSQNLTNNNQASIPTKLNFDLHLACKQALRYIQKLEKELIRMKRQVDVSLKMKDINHEALKRRDNMIGFLSKENTNFSEKINEVVRTQNDEIQKRV